MQRFVGYVLRFVGYVLGLVGRTVREEFTVHPGKSNAEALQATSRTIDMEDEMTREGMSPRKKRKTEVENWLRMVNVSVEKCKKLEEKGRSSWLPLTGDPVGKMQNQVQELSVPSKKGLVLDYFNNNGEPCLPTKLFGNKIKETLKKIWPCLVVDNISSIGIYGMGGVGKTTLAKGIKFALEQNNYLVYWVTVSQDFSISSLQDKIANFLGISFSNEDEEHVRANVLRAKFNKMEKSVLILDDLWEDFLLEDVGIAIGADKCRLIWTTRSLQVCDRMRCQRKFEVKTLDEEESWNLFKHSLGHETVLSVELEQVAKAITKKCAGLPLDIVRTAASMKGIVGIREWKAALDDWKSSFDEYHESGFFTGHRDFSLKMDPFLQTIQEVHEENIKNDKGLDMLILNDEYMSDCHVQRLKSDTKPAAGEIPVRSPTKMKKSASLKSAFKHFAEEDIVEASRPATVREKGAKVVDEEEVNAKADDFINRFKQQLKLQRLHSILAYKERFGRGSGSGGNSGK